MWSWEERQLGSKRQGVHRKRELGAQGEAREEQGWEVPWRADPHP